MGRGSSWIFWGTGPQASLLAAQKLLERFFEVVLGEKRLDVRPTKQLRLTYDASQTDDGRKRTVSRFEHDADEKIRRPAIKTRRCCKNPGGFFCLCGTGGDDLQGTRSVHILQTLRQSA